MTTESPRFKAILQSGRLIEVGIHAQEPRECVQTKSSIGRTLKVFGLIAAAILLQACFHKWVPDRRSECTSQSSDRAFDFDVPPIHRAVCQFGETALSFHICSVLSFFYSSTFARRTLRFSKNTSLQ